MSLSFINLQSVLSVTSARLIKITMAPKPDEKRRLKGTDLVHADDVFHGSEVAPSISVSTSRCPSQIRASLLSLSVEYA